MLINMGEPIYFDSIGSLNCSYYTFGAVSVHDFFVLFLFLRKELYFTNEIYPENLTRTNSHFIFLDYQSRL